MALYSYRAIDAQGKPSKGLLDAANVLDLEKHLKHSGLDLIDAKPDNGKTGLWRSKIKRAELITFFFNLEQLTHARVPLLESPPYWVIGGWGANPVEVCAPFKWTP